MYATHFDLESISLIGVMDPSLSSTSAFSVGVSIPLVEGKSSIATTSEVRKKPEILGIFTGQGAQWLAMGKVLCQIAHVRAIVSELDHSLQSLPAQLRIGRSGSF